MLKRSWQVACVGLVSGALVLMQSGVVAAAASTVVVSKGNPHGWFFFNEGATGSGAFVTGPGSTPLGLGSAHLVVDTTGRESLGTFSAAGTALAAFTTLTYSSYQANPGTGNEATFLQFDIDYDLSDTDTSYQGRLVFVPPEASVLTGTWQSWDALAGKWWASRAPGNTVCPQSSPCTIPQVLTAFPNAGVLADTGVLLFRAGGPSPGGFDGNVDAFTVGISGNDTTYDFENPILFVTPPSGPRGSSITVTSWGFDPGETVKVKYKTGTHPKSKPVCTATALADTSFSCAGPVPTGAIAGANGPHTIVAKGTSSLAKLKGTFNLTP